MQILNKKQWYKYFFNEGLLNRTCNYTIDEFKKIAKKFPSDKWFCMRNTKEVGARFYCDSRENIERNLHTFNNQYIVTEKAPDENILVQGEYDGQHGRVCFAKTDMRTAFREHKAHEVSRVEMMGVIGYERYKFLEDIIEAYPGHVVEFTFYSRVCGINNQDYIIWEIRRY